MNECKKQSLVRYEIEYLRGKIGQRVQEDEGDHIFSEENCEVKDCSFARTYFYRVEDGVITKYWKDDMGKCKLESSG